MKQQNTYHFDVMRRAIDYIDGATQHPVALDDIAAHMNMSPAHFQRLFTQWVGISPKRYQQYLTLDHAKTLLRDRFTTLETAGEIGLSGTGRLNDMFIRRPVPASGVGGIAAHPVGPRHHLFRDRPIHRQTQGGPRRRNSRRAQSG